MRWWPPEEQVPASLSLPEALPRCENLVELVHPELYADAHPEHFLAAHILLNDPQDHQTEVVVEFNGRLWRALRSAPGKWSAFVSPDYFRAGFNALRIVGSEGGKWCSLLDNRTRN